MQGDLVSEGDSVAGRSELGAAYRRLGNRCSGGSQHQVASPQDSTPVSGQATRGRSWLHAGSEQRTQTVALPAPPQVKEVGEQPCLLAKGWHLASPAWATEPTGVAPPRLPSSTGCRTVTGGSREGPSCRRRPGAKACLHSPLSASAQLLETCKLESSKGSGTAQHLTVSPRTSSRDSGRSHGGRSSRRQSSPPAGTAAEGCPTASSGDRGCPASPRGGICACVQGCSVTRAALAAILQAPWAPTASACGGLKLELLVGGSSSSCLLFNVEGGTQSAAPGLTPQFSFFSHSPVPAAYFPTLRQEQGDC